jgi:hypothetical protein
MYSDELHLQEIENERPIKLIQSKQTDIIHFGRKMVQYIYNAEI